MRSRFHVDRIGDWRSSGLLDSAWSDSRGPVLSHRLGFNHLESLESAEWCDMATLSLGGRVRRELNARMNEFRLWNQFGPADSTRVGVYKMNQLWLRWNEFLVSYFGLLYRDRRTVMLVPKILSRRWMRMEGNCGGGGGKGREYRLSFECRVIVVCFLAAV